MRRLSSLLLAAAITCVALPLAADIEDMAKDHDLKKSKGERITTIYTTPGTTFTAYRKLRLDKAEASFAPWYLRQQQRMGIRLSEADQDRILTEAAAHMDKVFREELTAAGFELVDQGGDGVLLVQPIIVDLQIAVPDVNKTRLTETTVTSLGEMAMELALIDDASGETLLLGRDKRMDRQPYAKRGTPENNALAAEEILRRWASMIIDGLNSPNGFGRG